MDNGCPCDKVTERDIAWCLLRHPYTAGKGKWGNNCHSSAIRSLGRCCLRSSWRPDPYAGPRQGKCVRWEDHFMLVTDPYIGSYYIKVPVCVEWELPDWYTPDRP